MASDSHPAADQRPVVLVVEDVPLVRLFVRDILQDWGFEAIDAPDAERAIEMITSSARVDLVLCDIVMPGQMDGLALARWVRTNRPRLKVILATGHSNHVNITEDLCHEGPIIRKPFKRDELERRVRVALASG
jgi:CheY-like chemotaxis protein